MIRLNNEYLELRAVLIPWRGEWHLVQEGAEGRPQFTRSWRDLQQALQDLVDLEGWEVLA